MSIGYAMRQRRRLGPALAGVAMGVTLLIIVLVAAASVGQTTVGGVLSQRSLHQITVTSNSTDRLNPLAAQGFRRLPHVTDVYPLDQLSSMAKYDGADYFVSLMNVPAPPDRPELVAGLWPQDNGIVVPETGLLARAGQLTSGTSLVGQTITLQIRSDRGLGALSQLALKVTGTYHAPTLDKNQPLASYASQSLVDHAIALTNGQSDVEYQAAATYPALMVDVDQPSNVVSVAKALDEQGFVTGYVEKTVTGLSSRLQSLVSIAAALLIAVIALAAFSIANMLSHSVMQRRKELGVMLAIGFTQRSVGQMVAGEALATGLGGVVLGSAIALLALGIFRLLQPTIPLAFPWWDVPVVAGTAILLCLVAAWLPARQAMRMDPVEALREE